MFARWLRLPEWARWTLLLPGVFAFTLLVTFLMSPILKIAFQVRGTPTESVLQALVHGVWVFALFYGVFTLAPRIPIALGWIGLAWFSIAFIGVLLAMSRVGFSGLENYSLERGYPVMWAYNSLAGGPCAWLSFLTLRKRELKSRGEAEKQLKV
jgi:hypothetical protein